MQCVGKHLDQFPHQIQAELAKKSPKAAALWPESTRTGSPVLEGLCSCRKTGKRDVKSKPKVFFFFFCWLLLSLQCNCSLWGISSCSAVHMEQHPASRWCSRRCLEESASLDRRSSSRFSLPALLGSAAGLVLELFWNLWGAQQRCSHHMWRENASFQHYSDIRPDRSAFLKNIICFACICGTPGC